MIKVIGQIVYKEKKLSAVINTALNFLGVCETFSVN